MNEVPTVHQHVDGSWSIDWPHPKPASFEIASSLFESMVDRINAAARCAMCGEWLPETSADRVHDCPASPAAPPKTCMLTDAELALMDRISALPGLFGDIMAHDRSRSGDMNEVSQHVHVLQNMVLAQAAARAYPDRFRLMGEVVRRPS